MNRQEELLFEALEYAHIAELPTATTKDIKDVWVRGVAKLINGKNDTSYAIVRNVYGKAPQVIKVFDSFGIREIVEVYPYSLLDMSFARGITKIEDLRLSVAKAYGKSLDEIKSLTKEELKILFYNYGIKLQEKKGIFNPIENNTNLDNGNTESEAGKEAE